MVVARAVPLSRGLSRAVLRRPGTTLRPRTWKQVTRRSYASGHGEQQPSELPWIIGSAAITIPAAGWLLQQGSTKSDHGHASDDAEHKDEGDDSEKQEEGQEAEEPQAKESEDQSDEKSDDGKDDENKDDDSKDDDKKDEEPDKPEKSDSDDQKSKKTDDSKDDGKGDDVYPPPSPGSPGQINWKPGMNKGPGEGQKGERKPTEKKGEKDSQGDFSGAKHPYINDAEKSKKGLGVTETAKIHGTVDPSKPVR